MLRLIVFLSYIFVSLAVSCQTLGVTGECVYGNQCDGLWSASKAGVTSGCNSLPDANLRCCTPLCTVNGNPGQCASSCSSLPGTTTGSSSTCGSAKCCYVDYGNLITQAQNIATKVTLPPRVQLGDTVAVVSPSGPASGGASFIRSTTAAAFDNLRFQAKVMPNAGNSADGGTVAGTDAQRAADIMAAFRDTSVKAIVAFRGGWGCARLLPLLDYAVIRANPKPFIGYSDATSCVAAIAWRAGFVAYVGPMLNNNDWLNGNGNHIRLALTGSLPYAISVQKAEASSVQTMRGGRAVGRLIGGNLSVFAASLGAEIPLMPRDSDGPLILVLEEIGEPSYRLDRYMAAVVSSRIMKNVVGFAFGTCSQCSGSFTALDIMKHHIAPLNIPWVYGISFGHSGEQVAIPIGMEAILDADRKTIVLTRAPTAPSPVTVPARALAPLCTGDSGSTASPTSTPCPPPPACPTCAPNSGTCPPCPQCQACERCPTCVFCQPIVPCECECNGQKVDPKSGVSSCPTPPPAECGTCPVTECTTVHLTPVAAAARLASPLSLLLATFLSLLLLHA
mmetsp:Transcript_15344/g.26409  ORF Transcript_15344/g.26409 Transcript_15344/m.26409 type:complete len:563 (-) Transcript_15344:165-1853(-)